MQRQYDAAAPGPSSAPSAATQRAASPQPSPFSISCLLEFQDARIEAAYQHYMYKMQQTADICLIIVNIFAVAVAYIKQSLNPIGYNGPSLGLCLSSGGQALALLLLLVGSPAAYARHRGLIVGCTRLYRLVVWLMYLREPHPPKLFESNLSLRLFLMSPAGGNIWLALFYPLPVSVHMLLMGMSTAVATWRSSALQERLEQLGASQDLLVSAYTRLSKFSKWFEKPTGRLLQRWPAPLLSDGDRVWCMYSFVTLVYGLLLPLLLLFIKEVHFRVRFLTCLRPALQSQQLASLRNTLYSITTAAVFLIITLVPCAWSLVQLASRYLAAKQGKLRLDGVLFFLTVLSLEVFMRFWLLAVMQITVQRVVGPGVLQLLVWLTSTRQEQRQQQQQQQRRRGQL